MPISASRWGVGEVRRAGFSLAELLVASGIFLLVMSLVLGIMVSGWKAFARANNQVDGVRQARIALARAGSDLRLMEQIYSPSEESLARGGTTGIIYSITDYRGPVPVGVVRGLEFDAAARVLKHHQYHPGYNPDLPASWQVLETDILASNITRFELSSFPAHPRLLILSITAEPVAKPPYRLDTKVLRRR